LKAYLLYKKSGEDEVEFTVATRYGPGCVITPPNSTDVPVWVSSAPEVVSVTQDGMIYP
jgi:hypothetical protein